MTGNSLKASERCVRKRSSGGLANSSERREESTYNDKEDSHDGRDGEQDEEQEPLQPFPHRDES